MKFPLEIVGEEEHKEIIISGSYWPKELHCGVNQVKFIIDTGSPFTLFNRSKVLEMQLPFKDRDPDKRNVKMVGINTNLYNIGEVKLFFQTAEGETEALTSHIITGIEPTSKRKKSISEQMDNIIGLNFLREQGLSLHYLPEEGEAYLKK